MKCLLVASKNTEASGELANCFDGEYHVDVVGASAACLPALQKRQYEFLFIDIDFLHELMPSDTKSGAPAYDRVLQCFWDVSSSLQIVILCSPDSLRRAVDAVRAGADNYLICPIDKKEARYIAETTLEAARMQYELDYLRDRFWHSDALELVRTNSESMKTVFERIKTVAPTTTTALITGETGTGKGVLASLIHRHSSRNHKQFIIVHCGAIPENLIESELFGHEKGAFTGAIKRKLGKFEIAQGGTILLDEIGTMPISAQIKLLQVLQDRVFQRVGGEDNIFCDVRVIAASNADLYQMIESGGFRKDLYYRLNVFPIEIPPLRERLEDLPLFVEVFLKRLNRQHAKKIKGVHQDVMDSLARYAWPGNIRELENLIERAYLLETSTTLTPRSFPQELMMPAGKSSAFASSSSLAEARRRGLEEIERNYLIQLLSIHQGRINTTAQSAGITARQLHKLMKRYGLRKEGFKSREPRKIGI